MMRILLTNQAKKLCIIGDPVVHSKSPVIQNALCQALGLDFVYLCQPVKKEGLPAFLAAAKELGYRGFNATMPFKELLVPYLDGIDPLAEKLGAVNTVCIQEGKLYGYNTDCPGFVAALQGVGFQPEGKRVLLLGAGGAAKAAALGLLAAGVARLDVSNRTEEKARVIAGFDGERTRVVPWAREALAQAAGGADLLVNATSLGMAGQGQFEDFRFLEALPGAALVSDLIYHPAQTALLRRAEELGHPTMNGLPLLMHQAILALEHFAQVSIDPAVALPVVQRALEEE